MTTTQTDPGGGSAARIREARRGAGLTQRELAALVGVTAHAVGDWEAGRRKPTPEHLAGVTSHCRAARASAAAGERNSPVRVPVPREERMRALIGAVARHGAEHGYPPSMDELMDETGFSSKSVVSYWLDACEEAGLLIRARERARAVTLTEAGRGFAEAAPESGGQPVGCREGPAPGATGTEAGRSGGSAPSEDPVPNSTGAAAADAGPEADRPPRRGDRKTPVRRGAYVTETGQGDPASGIAARIREARRSVGLTQRELAALVCVASHTVWSWEAGRMKPTYEHRVAIAFHCELHVDELEGRTGSDRDRLQEAVLAFRSAVAYLPERDIDFIWTFIRFVRWRRRRGRRAA
ncbi:MAG: helix-turn-helix domain-containing protein [Chloroflexi bacterium]|nr:helix-turn-helix domain-containing protein [Chloroflexota bacterium]